MSKIQINSQNKGIELYFEKVPNEAEIAALKSNGFRWNAAKNCWYAENMEENRRKVTSIFNHIDIFIEDARRLIECGDSGSDYAFVISQAGKQCSVILKEMIENEGDTVDEHGFVHITSDKRFSNERYMTVLGYAAMSPTLLPEEMRRLVDFIRKGRNEIQHYMLMNKEHANELLNAFRSFATWYYLHSGAYEKDQAERLPVYARQLNANIDEPITTLEKVAISNTGFSMDRLEEAIARIVASEVQKGVADVTGVVRTEAGEIKDKLDELSELVVGLSEKIGDYQSLVERQLSMATSEEEVERIIHAFSEECVSKMSERFERNEADKTYKRNLSNLKETLGEVCWERLDPRSRTFLVSARIMYDELIILDDVIDYSGVCLLVTKALEYELSKRFYTKFLKYLKAEYGKDFSKYPSTMLRNTNGNLRTMDQHEFTLGSMAYIFCMLPTQKEEDKGILLDFAEKELYKSASRDAIEMQIDSFAKDIDQIKSKYRNKAAHTNELTKKNAKECFDMVLDVQKLLKNMIEAFDKEG